LFQAFLYIRIIEESNFSGIPQGWDGNILGKVKEPTSFQVEVYQVEIYHRLEDDILGLIEVHITYTR
jgi:hypothetical protein